MSMERDTHSNILRHAGFRYGWVALLLCSASLAAYLWHEPAHGPNGGTWLGYTLGGVGAALILWLSWLGIRKRRYGSRLGSVKGWTSAHVWLGLSLVVVVSLHTGFQFGLNLHTFAYGLMLLVIVSGLWGLSAYGKLPQAITRLRAGGTRRAWIEELFDLNEQSIRLADRIGPDVHRRIVASADKVRIGGGFFAQLFGHRARGDGDAAFLSERLSTLRSRRGGFDAEAQSTVVFMAGALSVSKDTDQAALVQQLLDLLARRNALAARINRDIALHARLQLWLFVHVPLSVALLVAVAAHVLSVFYFW